ncbi:MAG: addiction module toxin RelE [Acidobacteria bacterium RIFCSPLOWO2_12_FULL_65_11]|nr:MAG: addiction module toxin RelE [Acidobacteria bacterium RIFCSPLOWO2_02_FULL_64_15]OFW30053.1 MAG: addiction module toxin RelE [Acidobacteria bacterium RIFCSPLOWO2_12_FULL_65_11]
MDTGIPRADPKPVEWIGSSLADLKDFPRAVQRDIGQALFAAQCGEEYPSVKALKGFGGRTVLEIVAPFDSNAYRAIYTVRFAGVVYVLHAFQKKSTKGIATPQREIDLIGRRLAAAERHHKERRRTYGEKDDRHPD